MEVILKQDVAKLGRIGELVKVKNGYARNYLLPRDLAVVASTSQKAAFEHQKRLIEAHKKKVQKASEEKAKDFDGLRLSVERRMNEAGKMFGSVSTQDVSELLKEKGHDFSRTDIELETIKTPGTYTVKLRLPGDVFADIKLEVKGIEEAEKKAAKKTTKAKAAKASAEGEEASAEDAVPLKRKRSKKTAAAEESSTESE